MRLITLTIIIFTCQIICARNLPASLQKDGKTVPPDNNIYTMSSGIYKLNTTINPEMQQELEMQVKFDRLGAKSWNGFYIVLENNEGKSWGLAVRKGNLIAVKDNQSRRLIKHCPFTIPEDYFPVKVQINRSGYSFQCGSAELNGNFPDELKSISIYTSGAKISIKDLKAAEKPAVNNHAGDITFHFNNPDSMNTWFSNTLHGQGRAEYSRSANDGIKGTGCLKIKAVDDRGKYNWCNFGIPISPGNTIRVSGKVKLENIATRSGFGFRVAIHFFGPKGYITWSVSNGETDNHGWRNFSYTAAAPQGASLARVSLRMSKATGTLLIDDIVISRTGKLRKIEALPKPAVSRLRVGLVADLVSSPVYQLADHLARCGVEVRLLQPADFTTDSIKQLTGKLDGLLLLDLNGVMGNQENRKKLRQLAATMRQQGKGIVIMDSNNIPDYLKKYLPLKFSGKARRIALMLSGKLQRRILFGVRDCTAVDGAKILAVSRNNLPVAAVLPGSHTGLFNFNIRRPDFLQWRYSPELMTKVIALSCGHNPEKILENWKVPAFREALKYQMFGYANYGFVGALSEDKNIKPYSRKNVALNLKEIPPVATWPATVGPGVEIIKAGDSLKVTARGWPELIFRKTGALELYSKGRQVLHSPASGNFPIFLSPAKKVIAHKDADGIPQNEPQVVYGRGMPLYTSSRIVGKVTTPEGEAVQLALIDADGKEAGRANWIIKPESMMLNGKEMRGFDLRLVLVKPPAAVISGLDMSWRMPFELKPKVFRLAAYSNPRGPFVKTLKQKADMPKNNVWYFNVGGQAFHFANSAAGGLISFFSRPVLVRGEIRSGSSAKNIIFGQRLNTGAVPAKTLKVPSWKIFYSPEHIGQNEWLAFTWLLKKEYCRQNEIAPRMVTPALQARIETLDLYFKQYLAAQRLSYSAYGKNIAPLLKSNFFKAVDAGSLINLETPEKKISARGGRKGIKKLTGAFKKLGVDTYDYWRITFWNPNVPALKDHPDWIIKESNGKPYLSAGLANYSLESGYGKLAYERLMEYLSLGIKGVWFDSLSPAAGVINYSAKVPHPMLPEVYRHFGKVNKAGLQFWTEGLSSVAVNSHWFRRGTYGDSYNNNYFMLFNEQLFANLWDSVTFLDYFKAAAFMGMPMVDFRVMTDSGDPLAIYIRRVNKAYLRGLKHIGSFRSVIDLGWGSCWNGEKGNVLFTFSPVRLKVINSGEYRYLNALNGEELRPRNGYITLDKETVILISTKK